MLHDIQKGRKKKESDRILKGKQEKTKQDGTGGKITEKRSGMMVNGTEESEKVERKGECCRERRKKGRVGGKIRTNRKQNK